MVLRQSASAYLASFLARAKYVRQSTLRSTFSHLLRWITDEVEEVGENYTDSEESKRRNTLFYTISQAVFYLLCFQGGFIAAADQGKEFLAAFLWERIIRSPMNPLKYCLESVRREFVRVARVLHLVAPALLSDLEKQLQDTGDSGIPKPSPRSSPSSSLSLEPKAVGTRINGIAHRLGGIGAIGAVKIVTAATTKVSGAAKQRGRGVGGLGSGSNPLDSYFPFDPYLLRRSFRFVAELYNEWEAIEEEEEDDDETSSEEGEEEEEEDAEEEEEEDDQREDDLPPEYSSYVSALSISAESTPGKTLFYPSACITVAILCLSLSHCYVSRQLFSLSLPGFVLGASSLSLVSLVSLLLFVFPRFLLFLSVCVTSLLPLPLSLSLTHFPVCSSFSLVLSDLHMTRFLRHSYRKRQRHRCGEDCPSLWEL